MDLEQYIQDLDREAFFRRLDYEWGKGLKHQVTRPDRCPDFRIITQPPPMHMYLVQWRKPGYNQHWQTVYSSLWHRACKDYLTAYLHFFPTLRLRIKDLTPRSKQSSATDLPKTSEARSECDNNHFIGERKSTGRVPKFDEVAWGELSGEPWLVVKPVVISEVDFHPCLCGLCRPIPHVQHTDIPPSHPRGFQLTFWGMPVPIW